MAATFEGVSSATPVKLPQFLNAPGAMAVTPKRLDFTETGTVSAPEIEPVEPNSIADWERLFETSKYTQGLLVKMRVEARVVEVPKKTIHEQTRTI